MTKPERPLPSPQRPSSKPSKDECKLELPACAIQFWVRDPRDKWKVNTMGALVQTKASRFALFKAIVPPSRPRIIPARTVLVREPRAFPEAPTRPTLPMTIRDEMVELYAFVFCQGGFRQLDMTFEQFLLVAASIKPADLPATREEARTFETHPARFCMRGALGGCAMSTRPEMSFKQHGLGVGFDLVPCGRRSPCPDGSRIGQARARSYVQRNYGRPATA